MTDQAFRSGCGHTPEDEQFDFCPICRIRELEEENAELKCEWIKALRKLEAEARQENEVLTDD